MQEVPCLQCSGVIRGADDDVMPALCMNCKRIIELEDKVVDLQSTVKILEDRIDQQDVQISMLKSQRR
jgi:hypothetical protein